MNSTTEPCYNKLNQLLLEYCMKDTLFTQSLIAPPKYEDYYGLQIKVD